MPEVLEEFNGYVTRMDEDLTYFTFVSELNGDKFYGHLPTSEVRAKGIEEEDSLWIKTVKGDDGIVGVEYGLLPDRVLTQEEVDEIARKIKAVFGEDDPGILY